MSDEIFRVFKRAIADRKHFFFFYWHKIILFFFFLSVLSKKRQGKLFEQHLSTREAFHASSFSMGFSKRGAND